MEDLVDGAMERDDEAEKVTERTEGLQDPIHVDTVDNVFSLLFILDLFPASLVSKLWRSVALYHLRRSSGSIRPPWLILHLQGRYSEKNTIRAFDPLSCAWYAVQDVPTDPFPSPSYRGQPPFPIAASCTTHDGGCGARLYVLTGNKMALSADPFGTTWQELESPRYWRTDPVVAVVGTYVVLVAGVSEFEDAPQNVVEMCRFDGSGGWEECDPMPDAFGWTGSLSVAVSQRRIYMVEKQPPRWASWFELETKSWAAVRRLRLPDPTAFLSAIGFVNERLVVVGASGSEGTGAFGLFRPTSVRFWVVDEETLEVVEELGSMPADMVAGLVEEEGGWGMRSIGFLSQGPYAYVYNPTQPKEFFLCEFGKESGGGQGSGYKCRWERVAPPEPMEEFMMHRMVVGCSAIGRDALKVVQQRPTTVKQLQQRQLLLQ